MIAPEATRSPRQALDEAFDVECEGRIPSRPRRRASPPRPSIFGRIESVGTIVCGVDHSPGAQAAIDVAIGLSRALGSRTVLVHAVEPPVPAREFGMPPTTSFVGVDQLREAGAALLDEVVERLALGSDVRQVVRIGAAADVIAAAAEESEAEFIVVGSRGLGPVSALLLGSVSRALAVRAPCPTVIVPAAAHAVGDGPILCAIDDSDGARAALSSASRLADRLGAHLVVIHVDSDDGPGSATLDRIVEEAGLGSRAERMLVRGAPATAIVEAANAHGADAIVIGSRGRGALAASVLGSVSSAVAGRSACPVIVVQVREHPDRS
jgi:nucleotide-binding universal stress UspA family protein